MFFLTFAGKSFAQVNDSINVDQKPKESLQDSTQISQDSIKVKQSMLTDIISTSAIDYRRFDRKENKLYLYNEAKVNYQDYKIDAGIIIIDNNTNEVYAKGIVDSTGAYTQSPVFDQGKNTIKPDSLVFNFNTKKALVYNSRTNQGAFNVKSKTSKRVNDSVYYSADAIFTTDDDLENPDYFFRARKIKFVPDKKIVTSWVNMYIADVPTPLGLPFGYFPLTDKQASGFIIPSFGENVNRGFFLQNGGYYFAISDYFDLALTGDYYSNGSYGFRAQSNYNVRYRFNGNFNFNIEKLLNEERGFPNFSEQSIFNIRWSHRQDSKSNPNSRFSASVNFGSSKYYRESVNQNNTGNFLNNTLKSSISYSKTFAGEPQMNLNVTATHSQNTNTERINMTLPTAQFSVGRIYPFAPKNGIKKGIIDNVNLQYNVRAENRINTTDSLFFKPQMFKDAQVGAKHSIPLSTNFKVFDHFSVSASTNIEEVWTLKTIDQSFDEINRTIVRDTSDTFDRYMTYNFSASVGTTVYGMFNFGDDKKIKAIRHVMQPSIGYSINPGFDQYYDSYTKPGIAGVDDQEIEYSRFEGTLYGAPGNRFANNLSFSLTNDFEAKVRKKDSTLVGDERYEKRKLLSNFSIGANYNLAADSLKLSDISLRASIPIIKDKLSINTSGALNMYALDNNNQIIDKLNINNGGSLFRLTRANVSFNYGLNSKDLFGNKDDDKDKSNKNENRDEKGFDDTDLFGSGNSVNDLSGGENDNSSDEDDEENETLYNYKIPWSLNLAYTMTYNNTARQNEVSSHSIMFSGDVDLSPKWSVGVSSGYDIKNKGFTFTQLRFSRDLNTWRMNFNWTPFGTRKSWFFFIGIKANVLSDIKYDKNRERDRQL
ncbi:MAG: putative LPS assembly protein LptD [Psychroflexus halocasei]|uniref:putative LPS assembly protein LptD n=1 Tax=Psychroflexus sp. S27 TaxID=1982757 RepID=UPI001EDD2801|nr:putative LPS assembly protein LptD [Psychroflexus sp. S27]